MSDKLTREQVIKTLERLERGWPSDLWIFSADGGLHLMETDEDGKRAMIQDAVDPNFSLKKYRIPSDGGDW